MDREQEIRLALCLAFHSVDEAKKAYAFVTGMETKVENEVGNGGKEAKVENEVGNGGKEAKVENEVGNGVYIIYEDGHHELFTGENDKDGIKSVGIVFDGHAFAVALKDLPKKYALARDTDKCEEGSPLYKGEVDSIFDWDAEAHTKHIVEAGTDIPLNDGEFIPTAAMLVAMYRMREQLNKALEYAGGEPLKTDNYYWSSSEGYQTYSWILKFGNGLLTNSNKCGSLYVRPCTAFNL